MRGYKIITQSLSRTNNKWPADGANYVEFINQGDGIVLVDDVQILPFGSWAPAPPVAGDADYHEYRVQFLAATNYNLISVRKYYIKDAV